MISNTHTAVTNYARDLFAPKNVNAPKWHFYINLTFKYIILKKKFSKETYKKKSLRWKPSKDRMRMGSQKERKRIEKGWSSLSSPFSIRLLPVSYLCDPILFLSFCNPFSVFSFEFSNFSIINISNKSQNTQNQKKGVPPAYISRSIHFIFRQIKMF